MTAQHTPGPWAKFINVVEDARGFIVADLSSCVHDEDQIFANAHLIAAAPDMEPLVALLASMPIGPATADDVPLYGLDGVYITHGHVRAARAAIAKARGQQ